MALTANLTWPERGYCHQKTIALRENGSDRGTIPARSGRHTRVPYGAD
jgi:hypothetical protein